MSPREPTLATLVIDAIQSRLLDFHVMLPAKIETYNSSECTVDVTLLIKNQRPDGDGTVTLLDFPIIKDVPISWMRCGTAWLTLPLVKGDTGSVVFADRNLSNWAASNKGEIVDPKDLGMHNLAGAMFIPGLTPSKSPISPISTDKVVLHSDTEVHLGEKDPPEFVALGTKVLNALADIADAFNAHTHTVAAAPGTAAPVIPAQQITAPSTVAATKVKAK